MVDLREYFRESNAIEDVHDESAVDAAIEAWEVVKDEDDLAHETVQTAHRLLLRDRQPDIAGEYRATQVHVGDSVPPPPVAVKYEMERLLSWAPTGPIEAVQWHVAFEHVHPFADGNGRVGRLLYLWHCHDLGIEPILWRAADREGYYALFQASIPVDEKGTP